jgi:uncharacterized protein
LLSVEFPDKDVTVRGAVSIGRPSWTPLAELVKLDPKSIGSARSIRCRSARAQTHLDESLSLASNNVGVEINTA